MTIKQKDLILPVFYGLLLIHLIFAFAGFYGGDDINFSRYAADLAHHGFSADIPTDHFQLRWTTIWITALFYKLWGVNAFTSGLFSFICVCLSGWILHKMIRRQEFAVYLFTMTLFFFSRSMIFYAHRLLPDAAICLSVLAMYYFYWSVNKSPARAGANAAAFSLTLLFGIMTKESIVISLPFFLALFLRDLYSKRNLHFWAIASSLSILLVFIYLLYFRLATGDFLFRYHLLLQRSYMNVCSFDQLPFIFTLKRIGYQLWDAMLLNGDLLVLFPAVAASVYARKIGPGALDPMNKYAFLGLLLCANFMTISWNNYVPLCHDPRHFIFIIPFAALAGGPMIAAYFLKPKDFPLLPLLYLTAGLIMIWRNDGGTKYLYILCAVVFCGAWLNSFLNQSNLDRPNLDWSKIIRLGFSAAFILLFALNYLLDFLKPLYPYHQDHKSIMERNFQNKNTPATVFSDSFTSEMSEYFLSFQTDALQFLSNDSIKNGHSGPVFYLLKDKEGDSDLYYLLEARPKEAIAKDSSGNMKLYQVNNAVLIAIKNTLKTRSLQ